MADARKKIQDEPATRVFAHCIFTPGASRNWLDKARLRARG